MNLKKLLNKPPITLPLNTPFGEDLEVIKNIDLVSLEQELNILLSAKIKEQIQKATNYQELSSIRNQEIKSYLEKERQGGIISQPSKELIKPFEQGRIFWVILLTLSILTIGGLLVKMKKIKRSKE